MRILVVSQYYRPEEAFIVFGIAEGLVGQGHSVQVLTSFPNYPQGKIYEGYRQKWRSRETINGVEVCRVPMFIDHSHHGLRRMLNYLSFAASATTARRMAAEADVVYVYATQMTAAMGPWLWRLIGGAPYVLHVQDLWPDSITGSSLVKDGKAARVIDATLVPWLRAVYRRASAVIAIAPRMVSSLQQRGVDPAKLHLIYNWARSPRPPETASGPGCTVLFAGNVGDMQDLETVVRAAHALRDTDLRVRIVGTGVALQRVQELSATLGTTNVEFLGRVAPESMGEIYADADYSLVTLKNLPIFEGTIPSKFQSSLANGLPVITTVGGDVASITRSSEVGFVALPEDVESLSVAFFQAMAQTVEERQQMAQRAHELYLSEFSYDSALADIEMILASSANNLKGVSNP